MDAKRASARAAIRFMEIVSKDRIKELEALPALHPDKKHLGDWYEIRRKVEESKANWGLSKRTRKPREPKPAAPVDPLAAFDRPGVVWGGREMGGYCSSDEKEFKSPRYADVLQLQPRFVQEFCAAFMVHAEAAKSWDSAVGAFYNLPKLQRS